MTVPALILIYFNVALGQLQRRDRDRF